MCGAERRSATECVRIAAYCEASLTRAALAEAARGERAPDSLYFLGQSLVQLKKPKDACRVYDELLDVYGATISAELKGKVTKGRADAKCTPA